jgi:hypothetical protein
MCAGHLHVHCKLQAWFDYEEAAKEAAEEARLREWCAENGVELV